jgi:hypothetical protein
MAMNTLNLWLSSIPRLTGITAVALFVTTFPLHYYIEWFGWSHTGDQYQWVPAFDLDAPELLAAFHAGYLDKPGPEWEHI